MKVRMFGSWQECAPIAARQATSENRIEIPADLLWVAIPTEGFQGNLQFRVPAAGRPNGRGRYQTEIDALLMSGMGKDLHLVVLVVRRIGFAGADDPIGSDALRRPVRIRHSAVRILAPQPATRVSRCDPPAF
jgi:hypothetical protein